MMSEHLCKIDIGDIDLTDQRYKISFSNEDIAFLGHFDNYTEKTYHDQPDHNLKK